MGFLLLQQCQEWLTLQAGFTVDNGYTWAFRLENRREPLILELRHRGEVVLTVEPRSGLPRTRFPAAFAVTFDGKEYAFYRMRPYELLEKGALKDLRLLNAAQTAAWDTSKAA